MTLSIQTVRATVSWTLPGANFYKDDKPSMKVYVKGTLTDAAGKELWWFGVSLEQLPSQTATEPEWTLATGYKVVVKEMLTAMRRDGLL